MEDRNSTVAGIGMAGVDKPPTPRYLDQLSEELAMQHDLLNILEEKLGAVSERTPRDTIEQKPEPRRIHVAELVGGVRASNRTIDRLIAELAV